MYTFVYIQMLQDDLWLISQQSINSHIDKIQSFIFYVASENRTTLLFVRTLLLTSPQKVKTRHRKQPCFFTLLRIFFII